MQVSPEVLVKGIESTTYTDDLIAKGIASLEKACDYIISTRISVERAQGSRQTGNPYRMRIQIRIPGRSDIIVRRLSRVSRMTPEARGRLPNRVAPADDGEAGTLPLSPARPGAGARMREEALPELIRRTFDSARRELERTVERQRGKVKTPADQQLQAVVESVFRDREYGFLRALDGQQVYFHKNSVLHRHWESLNPGTIVRYAPELGEKGLQASTVELVDSRGPAEMHERLHELSAAVVRSSATQRP